MKLSIIIPYYETYDLTKELITNLESQLTPEVEIIIIDDGCNETRLDNLKAKVIHLKENGGVSNSRNIGIKEAKGKYVAFIDSDDNVSNDYISTLLDNLDDTEVIYFNWKTKSGAVYDLTKGIPEWNCAVWKAIYKKDICPLFHEELRQAEDFFFQNELLNKKPTYKFINKVLYIYYNGREGSITSSWK